MFYSKPENYEKARELVARQILDGWNKEDIFKYWCLLGYDLFFVRKLVNPFFINTPLVPMKPVNHIL